MYDYVWYLYVKWHANLVLLFFILVRQCRKKIQKRWKKYRALWRDVLRVVAINITFAQINSSLPSVIDVQWPTEWSTFLKYFSFVNIGKFCFYTHDNLNCLLIFFELNCFRRHVFDRCKMPW